MPEQSPLLFPALNVYKLKYMLVYITVGGFDPVFFYSGFSKSELFKKFHAFAVAGKNAAV